MGKIVIAVCDDQMEAAQALKEMICRGLQNFGKKYEVKIYLSGEKLLTELNTIDIAFLDIDMPRMDGIAVGREIMGRKPECRIIVTSEVELRFKEAFQIRAVRFISKPFDIGEVEEALRAVIDIESDKLEVYLKRNVYSIEQQEICYVKAVNGESDCITSRQNFRNKCSLNRLEKMLSGELFFRVNKGYIVNLAFIEEYDEKTIRIGREYIVVSRRKKKEFEKRYVEFTMRRSSK